MHRIHRIAIVVLFALSGCDMFSGDSAESQRRERAELARDQQRERDSLRQEQSRDLAANRREARDDLADQTAEVRDEQGELDRASRELAQSIALACNGVATPDGCPIVDSAIRSSTNDDGGLVLHLRAESGTADEVRSRIECYRARTSLRPAVLGGTCVLDLAGDEVAVEVRNDHGHAVVDFTSKDETVIGRLRARVRELLTTDAPRRVGPARN